MICQTIRVHVMRALVAALLLITVGGCAGTAVNAPAQDTVYQPAPPVVAIPSSELDIPSPILDAPKIPSVQTGLASYYHPSLDGNQTASGVIFDDEAMMAAHPTWPLGTRVRVTNLEKSGAQVDVLITDRGPTDENVAEGVVIDLSGAAARSLDMIEDGRVLVQVTVLQWGDNKYQQLSKGSSKGAK